MSHVKLLHLILLLIAIIWKSLFYGGSGLCFTLHLHDPFSVGWEFNAFVFIALNSLWYNKTF